jgi:hypothetical protein
MSHCFSSGAECPDTGNWRTIAHLHVPILPLRRILRLSFISAPRTVTVLDLGSQKMVRCLSFCFSRHWVDRSTFNVHRLSIHFPGFVEHLVNIFNWFFPFLLPTLPARKFHFIAASRPTDFQSRQKHACGYSSCWCRCERVEEERDGYPLVRASPNARLCYSYTTDVETFCDTSSMLVLASEMLPVTRPSHPLSISRTFSRLFGLPHQKLSWVPRCLYVVSRSQG